MNGAGQTDGDNPFAELSRALNAVTTELGLELPKSFLLNILMDDDDWSLVIKCHALLESIVCAWLAAHLEKPALEAVLAEDVEMSSRIAMLKALDLCPPRERRMLRTLGTLRNRLVHSAKGTQFSFAAELQNPDKRTAFAETFLPPSIPAAHLASGKLARLAIWGLVLLMLAKGVREVKKTSVEADLREALMDALLADAAKSGEISEVIDDRVPSFLREHYEIREWRHAVAILMNDFRNEWEDVVAVLTEFRLHCSEILKPGGQKSGVAMRIDTAFASRGWAERCFATKIVIDEQSIESPTHKVDCFKNRVGLEIEWNNKDPFYDRDLNNFRLLFELRALDVGIIVTRCDELQAIFDGLGRGSSYGASTTHMSKLLPRLQGGSGGGCPVLVFGITDKLYVEDEPLALLPARS